MGRAMSPPSLLEAGSVRWKRGQGRDPSEPARPWPLPASGGAIEPWGPLSAPRDSQPCLGGPTACSRPVLCCSSEDPSPTGWDSPR